jgi:hypothetical protein
MTERKYETDAIAIRKQDILDLKIFDDGALVSAREIAKKLNVATSNIRTYVREMAHSKDLKVTKKGQRHFYERLTLTYSKPIHLSKKQVDGSYRTWSFIPYKPEHRPIEHDVPSTCRRVLKLLDRKTQSPQPKINRRTKYYPSGSTLSHAV